MNLKQQFDNLLGFENNEEQAAHDGQILAFQFLAKVDDAMQKEGMSKKELAARIGTSASFITQLFRGDRKPSWSMLAKMQAEFSLHFKVYSKDELDAQLDTKLMEYHRNWSNTRAYESTKGMENDFLSVLSIHKANDYPLAV